MSEHHHDHHDHSQTAAPGAGTETKYWQTLSQWGQDPEFQKMAETEFRSSPLREGAALEEGDQDGGWARREFLKLMGASLAMASAGCIRRPVEKIIPYNKQPEEVTFGMPNYYTSTYFDGTEALGLLIKTKEGRPTKIEGNPEHLLSQGATQARTQGAVLSLYDPERLKAPVKNLQNKTKTNHDSISISWEDADAEITKQLSKGGVAILTQSLVSPSLKALVGDFAQGLKAKHVMWEPLAYDDIREGQKASYGEDVVPFFHFEKAKVIVSIDADFLGTWISPTLFAKQFAAGRKDPAVMSQLVAFDSNYSLTGANADLRVAIKPSHQILVALGLAYTLVVKKGLTKYAGQSSVRNLLSGFADVHQKLGVTEEWMGRLADDLWKNKGQSLIVAGGLVSSSTASRELQIAVNFLNSALENDGITVDSHAAFVGLKGSNKALQDLLVEMKKGTIKTLILNGVNPIYFLGEAFHEPLKSVEVVISTADRQDETATTANYVLPDHHPLESWGDLEPVAGMYSIQQPTIQPMYSTRSFSQSLLNWGKSTKTESKRMAAAKTDYDFVLNFWKEDVAHKAGKVAGFQQFWEETLQKGVFDLGLTKKNSAGRGFRVEALSGIKKADNDGLELVMYPSVAIGDGRLANVSWLQELPDPVSKIAWDNYASLSMKTAESLKLKEGDIVKVAVGERTLNFPVHIQPGLNNQVVAIAIGYGRTRAGKVANGVGGNVFALAKLQEGQFLGTGQVVTLTKTNEKTQLACVAGSNSMQGRKIVAEATLNEYLKDKAANNHRHETFSMWSGHAYNGKKWGMAVDLNTCTGCSACMVACQAENNIPVVGKKYVIQGREMHWMRIDRYFVGDPETAETVFQPVMCQQCDNAPCETVCPVLATVHNSEGLNDMSYNRCVGTRYCSNNCPYKVRRFNWFNFTGGVDKSLTLQYNTDVTVRMRGVMEKCTFCVHRIKYHKNQAKLEQRELKDGEVKTACEQVCPSNAITFGDLNDAESRVAKIFRHEQRSYGLLEEFNAAPSVRYLTKIRNNNQATRNASEGSTEHSKGGHS